MRQIKDIMQSNKEPIVFVTTSTDTKQKLQLCQYQQETLLQGQSLPKGTFLLANQEAIEKLRRLVKIKTIVEEPVTAHVLHYYECQTGTLILDNSADLVVTPRLTGCTVVAELNTNKPMLKHINLRHEVEDEVFGSIDAIDQDAIDKEIETTMSGKTCFILRKKDYNFSDNDFHAATFMGFREGNSWKFYSQYSAYSNESEHFIVACGKQCTTSSNGLLNLFGLLGESSNGTVIKDNKEKENSNNCIIC